MNASLISPIASVLLSAVLLVLLMWWQRTTERAQKTLLESERAASQRIELTLRSTIDQLSGQLERSEARNDRLNLLLQSKDPMTYQMLSAMQSSTTPSRYDSYDPSDEGEIARIQARGGAVEDDLNDLEAAVLAEIGVDPAFFHATRSAGTDGEV